MTPNPDGASKLRELAKDWLENCSDHRGEQIISLTELLELQLALFAGQVAAAVDKGVEAWQSANCHDPGCGCVSEWVKREILALVPNPHALQEHNAALRQQWENEPSFPDQYLKAKVEVLEAANIELKAQIAELQQSGTLMINQQWVKEQIASAEAKARLEAFKFLRDNVTSKLGWYKLITDEIAKAGQQAEAKEEK